MIGQRAFDVPTHVIDGNDVVLVWQSAQELIAHARAGGGPSFLQADTYRIHGHMERERFILGEGRYRDEAEIAEWQAKDPIDRLAGRLLADGIADQAALDEVDARIVRLVDAAEAAADSGEPADPTLAERVMFAGSES